MKRVVGIDANHDSETRAVSRHRSKRVYPHFVERGFRVTRLRGKKAARPLVAAAAVHPDVVYLTGMGHGAYDLFNGQDDVPVFQVGNYAVEEVQQKIVHLLSCRTASGLGPDFVRNGTLAFFGYDDNFSFDKQSRDSCLECDSKIDRAFADGLTAGEVFEAVREAFAIEIELALTNGKPYVAGTLENNFKHLCAPSTNACYGRLEARLGEQASP